MIHEVRGSREANDQGEPLFFCTLCEEIFIGDVELDDRSRQPHGWPAHMECPLCGYLDGQGEVEDIAEAADRRFPRGTIDH